MSTTCRGSSPTLGSSRTNTSGSCSSACARPRRWRSFRQGADKSMRVGIDSEVAHATSMRAASVGPPSRRAAPAPELEKGAHAHLRIQHGAFRQLHRRAAGLNATAPRRRTQQHAPYPTSAGRIRSARASASSSGTVRPPNETAALNVQPRVAPKYLVRSFASIIGNQIGPIRLIRPIESLPPPPQKNRTMIASAAPAARPQSMSFCRLASGPDELSARRRKNNSDITPKA